MSIKNIYSTNYFLHGNITLTTMLVYVVLALFPKLQGLKHRLSFVKIDELADTRFERHSNSFRGVSEFDQRLEGLVYEANTRDTLFYKGAYIDISSWRNISPMA